MVTPRAHNVPESRTSAAHFIIRHFWWLAIVCAIAVPVYGDESTNAKESSVQNEALHKELVALGREDQAVRIGGLQAMKKHGINFGDATQLKNAKVQQFLQQQANEMKLADEKNRVRVKQIIDEHGWPGKSLVGQDGANAAWLIVQHSDADVKFQRQCLELIEAAPEGEVAIQHVVYLTDRVLVNEGKPQRYGTQMGENFQPRPLEDPENVDKRRAEAGLPPLAEYVRTSKEAYEKMASGKTETNDSDR